MRQFTTERRLKKIERTVRSRQQSLHVVLENIHDPHNVSAIFRTCDAVGVPKVSLLYSVEKFPKISRTTSSSASKWVESAAYESAGQCFPFLKKEGFKIYAATLDEDAVSIYDIDFTEKSAIVLGNEHRGVSEEAARYADKLIYIPMRGMIQSLNVSVAAAVILYEAQRQRMIKGLYENSGLPDEEIEKIIDEWCSK
jgi:tRNA (guanosine-2'-O-)-methyltransferase